MPLEAGAPYLHRHLIPRSLDHALTVGDAGTIVARSTDVTDAGPPLPSLACSSLRVEIPANLSPVL